MNKNLKVKCPKCKKKFTYMLSENRPFCSERCKMVDLGHWFEGNYQLASQTPLSEEDIEVIIKEGESKYENE